MPYQYIFSEKTVSGKTGQFLFCDEIFYLTNTTEFKKSEVEEEMTIKNSLCNRRLLDIK